MGSSLFRRIHQNESNIFSTISNIKCRLLSLAITLGWEILKFTLTVKPNMTKKQQK